MFTLDSHVNIHNTQLKTYDWGQYDNKLKYKYRKEEPITTYKLSKEEMEEYLRLRGYVGMSNPPKYNHNCECGESYWLEKQYPIIEYK